jgi:hypothetical protein
MTTTIATIASFPHARMSVADFERERARLQGLYGDSRKEAGARYEQALAKLFYVSGWTLKELATKEGKGKSSVSRMLIFGRFLGFLETENTRELETSPVGEETNLVPLGLTERRFRGLWDQTEGRQGAAVNERVRFIEVIRLMQGREMRVPRTRRNNDLGKQIIETYADGKWHDMVIVARRINAPVEDVRGVMENILVHKTFKCTAEKKEVAKTFHYRIFPQERQISTVELVEKLQPLLNVLEEQGRCNTATMSPPTVAFHTAKIQTLLNEWAGRPVKAR